VCVAAETRRFFGVVGATRSLSGGAAAGVPTSAAATRAASVTAASAVRVAAAANTAPDTSAHPARYQDPRSGEAGPSTRVVSHNRAVEFPRVSEPVGRDLNRPDRRSGGGNDESRLHDGIHAPRPRGHRP